MAIPSRPVSSLAPPLPTPYRLLSIEKDAIPADASGRNWYRYELHNGRSTITGQRCGTLEDVTAYANDYAQRLNARAVSGHSPWTPRSRKHI